MRQYFKECSTVNDVKKAYRELAKKHHPDIEGGDVETMQTINNQYYEAISKIINADTEIPNDEKASSILHDEQYREALEKIISLPNINIELIGDWIWVSGNTFEVKEQLKDAKFLFSNPKKMWYFRSDKYKMFNKGKPRDIEEIRAKHGSEKIKSFNPQKISA